jgi:hypothetical protein
LCIAGDHERRRVGTQVDQRGDARSREGDVVGSDDLGRILCDSKAFDRERRKRLDNRDFNSARDSLDAVRVDDDDRSGRG